MANIRIDLDPSKLANADLDLRYEIPLILSALPSCTILDRGYDYTNDDPPKLTLFMESERVESDVEIAIKHLKENEVMENKILDAATIQVSANGGEAWQTVFPESNEES